METFEYFTLPEAQISEAKAEARAKFRRLTFFMSAGAKTPNITAQEERDLITRARQGCTASVQRIVESHEDFVAAIAIRVARQSNAVHLTEDIFSTALDAFFKAIAGFDVDGEVRLNSYARYRIVGDCRKYALDNAGAIARGKGSDERKAYFNRKKLARAFKKKWGYAPTSSVGDINLLSDLCGIPPKALKRGMFGNVVAVPLHQLEVVSKDLPAEDLVQKKEASEALADAFEALRDQVSDRNYQIVGAMRDGEANSMVELSQKHGITPERVGQIVRASAKILRHELARRGIDSRADLA